jgi:hypothetical protein
MLVATEPLVVDQLVDQAEPIPEVVAVAEQAELLGLAAEVVQV